jgi:glycogen synthase
MHICYLAVDYHGSTSGGGIASYINTIGRALVKEGHKVTVLTNGTRYETTCEDGINLVRAPFGNLHWYLHKLGLPGGMALPVREMEWSLVFRRRLEELIEKEHIDVIEGCESGLLLLGSPIIRAIPLVVRLHGEQYVFAKNSHQRIKAGEHLLHKMEIRSLRSAVGVTAPSSFRAHEVANELRWRNDRISVIPNPISPWMLDQALGVERNASNGNANTVLYTGRVAYVKGSLVLLDAVPMITRECPQTRFVLAGARHTSIDDLTLNQLLQVGEVARHVDILGHVSWRELTEWYRKASIFVLPSYYETGGISAIEAMAFGLPVVASRTGGIPEVVEDGVTGILVPPGDSKALGEAVIHLLREPDLRRRLGQAGRQRVLDEFTLDRVLPQTLSVYQNLSRN